ncbi:hypothetical protein HPB48_019737 [Haemaphysalis longicornis]|uniref:ABC transporter domain-containing protein n=1 Tax=Haemaphysalis longicornis TaxID=44386 RepID=A0A9J6G5W1_HAELO|nr:hypothetical protein HPB48_019737 [Haemaphysalis longicornis]
MPTVHNSVHLAPSIPPQELPRSPPTASRVTGADVARERAVVERVCAGGILADYALVVKDVSRFFGSFAAVRGVSLAVRPGECLGLLGVSGSGKTALLNMIAGITPLSSGNCYSSVGDILGDLGKWQSNIGVCPYPGGFTESMHARGFLRLVGRLRGIPAWRLADSVESMISLFDLEALADIPHQAYTLGDKRRLSIAAALLNMPPIVLLDDPYAGVDFALKKMIAGVLKQVRLTAKTSILLATHR